LDSLGKSSLFTGERRSKEDVIFHCLGDVDELNANIGVVRQFSGQTPIFSELDRYLEEVQSRLLDIGTAIATPKSSEVSEARLVRASFDFKHVQTLESWIDSLDSTLPPLKNFILPSGGLLSAHLHMARAVCRRAERTAWQLFRQHNESNSEEIKENLSSHQRSDSVPIYLNRLSDFLFVSARFACMKEGFQETIYKKGKET